MGQKCKNGANFSSRDFQICTAPPPYVNNDRSLTVTGERLSLTQIYLLIYMKGKVCGVAAEIVS